MEDKKVIPVKSNHPGDPTRPDLSQPNPTHIPKNSGRGLVVSCKPHPPAPPNPFGQHKPNGIPSFSLSPMTRHRFLGAANSSAATAPPPAAPDPVAVDSDFVVILAALLCALICVLGLIAVARCAWLRRLSSSPPAAPSSFLAAPAASSKANKGLKKKVLRSLPKLTVTPDAADRYSDCTICLLEFADGDEIRVLPHCGHAFHVSCIDPWLGSHSSCPSCRRILVAAAAACDKCGSLPAATPSSSSASASASGTAEAESRMKQREDQDSRFLP
ncbi:LOW QUALITY PROTEIN: RING-H2 finger protein ATL80 [Eucalyptus grandis]|uniref:LOW QUALITY PROTEIN: RING-H2 finger protein ATL80 n=1 Tax=Eucalyptus grandis TaxID=71139 RepID=UPI00192EF1A7|nr:LOW QUALITY PROTEIN: RING-H2 finger protein ATL80 [Eucalyptus grandis]